MRQRPRRQRPCEAAPCETALIKASLLQTDSVAKLDAKLQPAASLPAHRWATAGVTMHRISARGRLRKASARQGSRLSVHVVHPNVEARGRSARARPELTSTGIVVVLAELRAGSSEVRPSPEPQAPIATRSHGRPPFCTSASEERTRTLRRSVSVLESPQLGMSFMLVAPALTFS